MAYHVNTEPPDHLTYNVHLTPNPVPFPTYNFHLKPNPVPFPTYNFTLKLTRYHFRLTTFTLKLTRYHFRLTICKIVVFMDVKLWYLHIWISQIYTTVQKEWQVKSYEMFNTSDLKKDVHSNLKLDFICTYQSDM